MIHLYSKYILIDIFFSNDKSLLSLHVLFTLHLGKWVPLVLNLPHRRWHLEMGEARQILLVFSVEAQKS